jgi:transcriptional regulator with XRE-family HTH domain
MFLFYPSEVARRTSFGKSRFLNATGERIRELRQKKAWSQADLARRLQVAGWDIDPATLNRIEKRRRTVTDVELMLIAKILKSSLGQFDK